MATMYRNPRTDALLAQGIDPRHALDENGEYYRVEFIALHSAEPVPESLYMNDAYGFPIPYPFVFDTSEWPEGDPVTHASSWKGERCMGVWEFPFRLRINGGTITIDFAHPESQGSFEPVPIPSFLQGR